MADDDDGAPAPEAGGDQPAPEANQGPNDNAGQDAKDAKDAKDEKGAKDGKDGKEKDGKDKDDAKPDEESEAEKQEALRAQKFRDAQSDPRGDSGSGQAVHAARTTGARKVRAQQYGEFRDSDIGNLYIGSNFLTTGRPSLVAGPVSADELQRLRAVFFEPDGYRKLRADLKNHRLLVLSGDPGSGRTFVGLSLLAEVATGAVNRLDPGTDLSNLAEDHLGAGCGYLLEPPADDSGPEITAMYLDRYAAQLAERGAFAVIVVDGFGRSEALARSRFGRPHRMPSADGVLAGHLRAALPGLDAQTRAELVALAARPATTEALGLRELRPGEARALSALIAARHRGELDADQFLGECRRFVPAQVQEWFAELSRRADPRTDAALRALAFRIALAVFDGASYDLVVEAAERLARELAVTARPVRRPGRPLATGEPLARIAAARAEVGTGTEELGRSSVPVRTVEFAGDRLPSAVLLHLWDRNHNLRGPVLGWLRALGQDARTVTWMRSAVAAGLLASLDFPFAYHELVLPMATSPQGRSRLFAATVLDQAATDERIRPAVASLVKQWSRSGSAAERGTAAFVHGYGRVAGSVEASLRQLRLIGTADDGEHLGVAHFNVVELLGGSAPEAVLRRISDWLDDERRVVVDLALLAVMRMVRTRTADVWDSDAAPWFAGYADWPLPLALAAAQPALTEDVADVIWAALRTSRTSAVVTDGIAGWLRGVQDSAEDDSGADAAGNGTDFDADKADDPDDAAVGTKHGAKGADTKHGAKAPDTKHGAKAPDTKHGAKATRTANTNDAARRLAVLCDLLPRLVGDRGDYRRLRHLVVSLRRDPDEPLDDGVARRVSKALQMEAPR